MREVARSHAVFIRCKRSQGFKPTTLPITGYIENALSQAQWGTANSEPEFAGALNDLAEIFRTQNILENNDRKDWRH